MVLEDASNYGRALLRVLAMERWAMLNDGLKPVAVKLTSPEVQVLRKSLTPMHPGAEYAVKIFGLGVLEVNDPVALAERFVCADGPTSDRPRDDDPADGA